MPDDNLRRLTTIRAAHRGQMTKLLNRADEVRDGFADPPLAAQKLTFQALLDSIITKFGQLKTFDEQLIAQTVTDDLSEAIVEADDYINELNIKIERHRSFAKYLISITKEAHVHQGSNLSTGGAKTKVNLPKLQLPKFDGNYLKWTGFIDAFTSAVDKDSSLENIQKFQYLIAQLIGEAAKTIEGLQLTNANYIEALEILKQRYGQPHKLIASYMKALWELPKPTHSIDSIRTFYDNLETHIRGLRSLGKLEDSYGDLLVPIVFEKLPGYIKTHISREHGDKAWTIQELKDAIYKEIQAAQAGNVEHFDMGNGAQSDPASAAATFHVGFRRGRNPPGPPRKRPPTSSTREIPPCAFCKGQHWHNDCVVVSDIEKRRDIVKHASLCFNCLRGKHRSYDCLSKGRCHTCQQKHHTSLCLQRATKEDVNPTSYKQTTPVGPVATHATLTPTSSPVILKTAVGVIETPTGKACVNILLDEGAQRSFITQQVATKLGIRDGNSEHENIRLATFGTQNTGVQSMCVTTVRLQTREEPVDIRVLVVPNISSPVKNYTTAAIENYPYLRDLPLAETVDADLFQIDLLIGADHYWSIVNDQIVRGPGPTAVNTKLGYLMSGPTNLKTDHVNVYHTTCLKAIVDNCTDTLADEMKMTQYWDLETIGIRDDATVVNKTCQFEQFRDQNLRMENNKYIAKLPWRDDHPPLPTNYNISYARTRSMVTRLSPELRKTYNDVITEQLKRDFIEIVPDDDVTRGHYIPHHCVKKDSTTTPIRIVYDCSCKTSNNPSLNDCLETGPPLLNDLVGILLRFRENDVAFTADIEKAFLNVRLEPEDREYTKFLWLSDPDDPESDLMTYQFKVVLFGSASSPFILNAVVKTHLEANPGVISDDLKRNIYVDNAISGVRNDPETQTPCSETALDYYVTANDIMQKGGFKLRMWATNDPMLRKIAERDENNDPGENVNVVGLRWSTDSDMLTFASAQSAKVNALHTKREVVRTTSSLDDPLGLLSPVHVQAKVFIQQLWKSNTQWDDMLSDELTLEWEQIRQELDYARDIKFQRAYFNEYTHSECELHTFVDASTRAYGAVTYLKRGHETSIVMAKTRVKPPKETTLPRLELMAALIGTRLTKFVINELSNIAITKTVLWCDSQIVIHWIRSEKKLPIFVANRVREIRSVEFNDIKYCPTKDNPADLLTRGVSAKDLSQSELWWKGPCWLPQGDWPICALFDSTVLSCDTLSSDTHVSCVDLVTPTTSAVLTVKADKTHSQTTQLQSIIDIDRYSSLGKLLRVTAYVIRFIAKLRKTSQTTQDSCISAAELHNAKQMWIKSIQSDVYALELKALSGKFKAALVHQLKLVLDMEGIIRCSGRFQNANLSYAQKCPILLPSKHKYTFLQIEDTHKHVLHAGVEATITSIRQTYWIPTIRRVVKSVIRKCSPCLRVSGKAYSIPPPPPLPECRIREGPPFSVTGVDFTGALYYRNALSNFNKAYVCLFTCATTRAVHLELVIDMTALSFLRAFRRFASRRSLPSRMISDNASTFLSAVDNIKAILDHPIVKQHLATNNVQWTFIPKRAPWFGGFYERLIGITKTTLKKVLGRASVTLDELTTLLTEVEAVINDRPITYVTSDANDVTPLTPSHFVNGRMITPLPHKLLDNDELVDPNFTLNKQTDLQKRMDFLDKLFENCWKRWRNEYLPALRENHKSNSKPGCDNIRIRVGDIVLVHSDTEKRVNWSLAKVTKLHRGADGFVRSADIQTKRGVTNRPIAKLYSLEVNDNSDSLEVNDNSADITQQERSVPNVVPSVRPVRQAAVKARGLIAQWAHNNL